MRKKLNSWEDTQNIYVKWLSDSLLRLEFSKSIRYKKLSLWWLCKLVEKDNINEPKWFENLHKKLNKKKIIKKNNIAFLKILFGIIKISKRIISKIVFITFIKIFFKEKTENLKDKKNCFYGVFSNFIERQNKFVDRQYGLSGLSNNNNYFIEFQENFSIIFNYFKIKKQLSKIPFNYLLSSHHISIFEIIRIYLFSIKKLFYILLMVNKKNYFYIKNIDCQTILKDRLIESFFGPIQDQLLKGISLENGLKKLNCVNFLNCFDFHPQSRVLYYFSKNSKVQNVININHACYTKNNFFFNFVKSEFSSNEDTAYYSPKPDIFFCQGVKYYKKLKKIFVDKKIYKIGSLKIELNKTKLKLKKKQIKNLKKKLIILCGLNDYRPFIKLLNLCNLEEFKIIVAPHPLVINKTISDFKKYFNKKFITGGNLNKTKIFNNCDYIIFGDASLGLELAIMKYNVIRVYDKEFIPTFDIDKEIPTATNFRRLNELLKKKSIPQKSSLIEKNYFYKYDNKASHRLHKILQQL